MKPRAGSLNGIASASHICCAMGCARPIHPTLFMCTPHWRIIPEYYRKQYNRLARLGSPHVAEYQRICIEIVAAHEGLIEPVHATVQARTRQNL